VADWIRGQLRDDVVATFRRERVPVGPVNDLADLVADPHVLARQSVVHLKDADLGAVNVAAPSPHLSATPGRIDALGGGSDTGVELSVAIEQWTR
jgi:crotonobetainyl-CoA:carnitine CoA-transferase CaiB-like acyl-CoA transferase